MVLCPGRHPFDRREDGPPQRQPTGQPGPCCGGCRASGALAHEGPLWGAWPSHSCCWDPREGCAGSPLPYPCHPRWPGGPAAPARSAESLTTSAISVAISSAGTASPPAPCCPGAEGPVEEALSAMLASCRLSAEAAIDRRSFIASGLASQLLEELLSPQLPAAKPGPAEGPEEQCRAAASLSLERLRRHNHCFQRAKERFQKQGWAPGAEAEQGIEGMPCYSQPRESRGQGSGAQPCREACGHLSCGAGWHGAHGCCAQVETVNSACPWDGDQGTVSHPSREPCGERGHGRGPAGQPPLPHPGTSALARREPHQRPEKCWGSPRDTPEARPARGAASIPRHGQPSCAGTASAVLGPEPRPCWGTAGSVPRAGREPRRAPEPTQQPRAQQAGVGARARCGAVWGWAQPSPAGTGAPRRSTAGSLPLPSQQPGPAGTLRCRDGEPAHGCGTVPGCLTGPQSRGGGRQEPRSRERAGRRDVTQSHHDHREWEEMLVLESWSRGQEPSGELGPPGRQRPLALAREGSLVWEPSPCPGTTNAVRFIARSFELRAQQDAARAKRERQARRCQGARTANSPPGCSGAGPRAQGWLLAEAVEGGTAGAQAAAQPRRGGRAGDRDGEEGRQRGGHSRAPPC